MTAPARVLAGVLSLLVVTTAASAQSISASPNPFTPGATITVTAQSPAPPPPGTNVCGLDPCYVLATYATVYIQRGSAQEPASAVTAAPPRWLAVSALPRSGERLRGAAPS